MPTSIHACLHDQIIIDLTLGVGFCLATDIYCSTATGDAFDQLTTMTHEQREQLYPVAVWTQPVGSGDPSERVILTVNVPEYPIPPGHILVRTTEETELTAAARRSTFFEDTGERVRSGHILLELWRVLGWEPSAAGSS